MTQAKAFKAIDKAGALLVFPIKDAREPPSLWYALYPKSKMRWDWSEDADPRVVDLWHLRTELSLCKDVVYTKWFKNRATFFSRPLFSALLRVRTDGRPPLAEASQALYDQLLEDSPQTSRMLRAATGLFGKEYESAFNRGLKPLWERLLAVGFGEIDEGSYPSLGIGATKTLFEDLWDDAQGLSLEEAWETIDARLPGGSAFRKWLDRLQRLA